MAFLGRLVTLAKSPQGRRLLAQAGKAARDPENRERLEKMRSRLQSRGDSAAKPPAAEPPPAAASPATGPQRSADAANDA